MTSNDIKINGTNSNDEEVAFDVTYQVGNNECCGFAFVPTSKLPGLDGKQGG